MSLGKNTMLLSTGASVVYVAAAVLPEGVLVARYMRMMDFLSSAEHQQLLEHALARQADMRVWSGGEGGPSSSRDAAMQESPRWSPSSFGVARFTTATSLLFSMRQAGSTPIGELRY
jgi:hypothetical protein